MAPRLLCCPTPLIPDFGTTGLSLSRGYRLPWRVPCAEGPQVWSWGQTHSEHCRPLIRMLGATRDAVAGVFTRRPPLSTVSRKSRFAGWKEVGRVDEGWRQSTRKGNRMNSEVGKRAVGRLARAVGARGRGRDAHPGQRAESILEVGFTSQLPGTAQDGPDSPLTSRWAAAAPREPREASPAAVLEVCTRIPGPRRLGTEPFSGGGEGRRSPALGPQAQGASWSRRSTLLLLLSFALCSCGRELPARGPQARAPPVAPGRPLPRVVRPGGRPLAALAIKAWLRQPTADSSEMRPRGSGQGAAGRRVRPGAPARVTLAPRPAASPAPEPSARPERGPAHAPAGAQAAGSRSACVSGPQARARPTPKAGSAAGAPRTSTFSVLQGNAQAVPRSLDAPWTRFIFQGPLGPRAAGLGTGKAAGIWRTPAAHIGRRPGVSGPDRAAFIRELEEALCPDRPLPVKITQEDVKVMLNLLEERERDLNTAARIGQSLVKQNSVLMAENSKLEAMLGSAREEILHLRHQVSLRDDLLQLYSDSEEEEEEEEEEGEEEEEEEEEEETEEEEEEEEEEKQHDHPYGASELTSLGEPESLHFCPQLEALQEQLRLLEVENEQLREEASQLDALEEEEQMLILDCVEQFSEASQQMAELSEVLALRMESHDQQRREVTQLRTQVLKLQRRCQSYGVETEKLQQQLVLEKEIQMRLQDENLQVASQLQGLQEKYTERGGMLTEAQEEVKTLRQQASVSTGPVTHYTYTAPLDALPGFQETLAEELRMSIRRIISDPVFFMERNHGTTADEMPHLGYKLRCGEAREQGRGFEAEKGLMRAEDFVAEDFVPSEESVPEEEPGAAEEVVPADERSTEEAELVSEETEAWEEVEPQLDETTKQTNTVTSTLEATGLGPSHLSMKHVLQQLANWQDSGYRRHLRRRMLQEGFAVPQQPTEAPQTDRGPSFSCLAKSHLPQKPPSHPPKQDPPVCC
ncbi:huntingtin-associated protein 1 isoform X3 [Vulpes lagopus]|uniref:huntingtin-associated protein 1 isoform X3 n=1 Tax=Vulpes lagopus TaxID=494514 RepID=UPI001BCA564F|nr:huntingtin-associated protein 1 isoform X3 [Vulpes lagopus]